MTDKLMTLQEVSEYLNISKDSVYKMSQQGEIPAFKVVNQWRYKKEDIDKWLETKMNTKKDS